MPTPLQIVKEMMYDNDAFSQWLGISLVDVSSGNCTLSMEVSEEMTNGFGIAHGGIAFSLADSALAFAANSIGKQAVSIETSISHTYRVKVGDTLVASSIRLHQSNKFASYQINVLNQDDKVVALFKGTVFYTGKDW